MATTTRVLTASVNGTVYTTNANGALEAIDTCHSGATAPTDELANGKFWLDTTTTPGILKMYNNSVWEEIGGSTSSPTFNTVNATTLLGDGSGITGLAPGYADADVDTHLNFSTATTDQILSYNGSDYDWVDAASGSTGGGSDEIFWENGQNVTTNYTITNGKNAMSAGPITIDSGVTVTVGAGETWTVV